MFASTVADHDNADGLDDETKETVEAPSKKHDGRFRGNNTLSLFDMLVNQIYKEISPSKKHDGRFRSNNTLTIRRARNLGCV